MPESVRPPDPASPELALTALRFAAGELSEAAATAFAARVAADPLAQNALEEAMRLSAAVLGQSLPTPDPLLQAGVRDRLRPNFFSRVFPRRPYHGHPATWAGLGGVTAAVLTVFSVWLGEQPQSSRLTVPTTDLPHAPALITRTVDPVPAEPEARPSVWVSREPLPQPTVIVETSPMTDPIPSPPAFATVSKPVDIPVASVAETESRPHEPKAAITLDGSAPAQ